MKKRWMDCNRLRASLLVLAFALLLPPAVRGQEAYRGKVDLGETWQIQPAVRPEVAPRENDWGSYGSWNWGTVWRKLEARGTSWEKVKRADVHDLWWRQSFNVPEAWIGKRILVDFRRIEGDAVVFVNDTRIGELLRPGGTVDITDAARPGENTLRVFLTRNYTGISRPYKNDPLRFETRQKLRIPIDQWGFGITAPVTVTARPRELAVDGVFVKTSYRRKRIAVDLEVQSTGEVKDAAATVRIFDATGAKVLEFSREKLTFDKGVRTVTVESDWAEFTPWELDAGYVYTASVELAVGGKTVDLLDKVNFGFREVWTDGRQLMMNGHPIRFRLGWSAGLTPVSLSFFRLMHFNAFEFQPNPTAWWANWAETPYIDPALLDALDRTGSAALVLAPGVSRIDKKLLEDPRTRADYTRETDLWIRRYRNHPSVLTWIVGMNYVGNKENIHADGMGRKANRKGSSNEKVVEAAVDIVKAIDPTRLVFSHADGNVGDISSSNVYLNFVPLQERIEWPSDWHEKGDMPYLAVEFGQPHTGNFWKGPRFLLTEYMAKVFGDRAYTEETLDGLKRTVELGLANKNGHGTALDYDQFPLWWDYHRLFTLETDRAWRTWGVQGWFYWDFYLAYGDPPGFNPAKKSHVFQRYGLFMDKPVTEPPPWVNRNFHIHREAQKPLVVYIGGAPEFTDKTRAYYDGETIRKQIVLVWDGPGTRTLEVVWNESVVGVIGELRDLGRKTVTLNPGDIVKLPVETTARAVPLPGGAQGRQVLVVKTTDETGGTETHSVELGCFPRPEPVRWTRRVAVFDPAGKPTPWLKTVGIEPIAFKPGDSLDKIDLLVIGREALTPGDKMPYTAADLAGGLRVLVLEQTWQAWQGLGFRTLETLPRQVFAVDAKDPLMRGLEPDDLTTWRGSPDLLPAKQWARSYDSYHAPRWGNRHAVASVILEVPQVVGFVPRLNCDVDLNYTPLIDFRYGKGRVTFSTLDFTGRVGVDPSATRLAVNLLDDLLHGAATPTKATSFMGRLDQRLLNALGLEEADEIKPGGLIVSDADILKRSRLYHCDVFMLPMAGADMPTLGFKANRQTIWRATPPEHPLFASIGPRLLRWRDGVTVDLIGDGQAIDTLCDGLFAIRKFGGNTWLTSQLPPDAFDNRYPDDPKKRQAAFPSRRNLRQLYARLLTGMGAEPSKALAERLTAVGTGRSYETLGSWQVLGPFHLEDRYDARKVLDAKLAGHDDAVKGDPSPDARYTLEDRRVLDWRKTVNADETGFVDLGKALGRDHHAAAFVTRKVQSKTARRARLRLGVDYWMKVWVNGKLVYDLGQGHGAPLPNRHRVDVDLKKGMNVITVKVVSGSKGFGFWANLSREGSDPAAGEDDKPQVELYPLVDPGYDPYEFHYW